MSDDKPAPEPAGTEIRRVLVGGSSGLIGTALLEKLQQQGIEVRRLRRGRTASGGDVAWDVDAGKLNPADMAGFDAVVHLGGVSISEGRWTPARRQAILDSRVSSVGLLASTLAGMSEGPKTLVTASAIGIYGDRGAEALTEDSAPGTGFLAKVCQEWEAASEPAHQAGIRTVQTRFGLVLSPRGGAMGRLLPLFRAALGGRIGSGRQHWSWIALDDVAGGILHALRTPTMAGPVNFVAPDPVTNAQFTTILARVLSRPAFFPAPAFALRLALGGMADELLLASQNVKPKALSDSGYNFEYSALEDALRSIVHKPS